MSAAAVSTASCGRRLSGAEQAGTQQVCEQRIGLGQQPSPGRRRQTFRSGRDGVHSARHGLGRGVGKLLGGLVTGPLRKLGPQRRPRPASRRQDVEQGLLQPASQTCELPQ